MKSFRDLKFWERAHHLVVRIYEVSRNFPKEELVNLTASMRRAATTTASALVEGVALNTDRDQVHLAQSAIGATGQLEYLLLLARDLGYLDTTAYEELNTETLELRRQLVTHLVKVKAIR